MSGANGHTPTVVRRSASVDEYDIRRLALEKAVETHGATADEGQVVSAAKEYLAFLTGSTPEAQS